MSANRWLSRCANYPKAREEFKRALMDVVAELDGGGDARVEAECARLLAHFS